MPQPSKIPLAFAASGDKNIIPESTETTGLASWRDGFPAITSAPFSEGGIAPKRADFNGIFNALSQAVMWLQQGGVYAYDVNTDYEAGNVVLDAGGLYVANAGNGPSSVVVQPSSDTTGATWKPVRLDLATQSAAGYMSAEDKAALDGVPTTYLPLSGGTMTGTLKTSDVSVMPGTGDAIAVANNTGRLSFCGGTQYGQGARALIYGTQNVNNPGEFILEATNGSAFKSLIGKPDGTLTWDGNTVITSDFMKNSVFQATLANAGPTSFTYHMECGISLILVKRDNNAQLYACDWWNTSPVLLFSTGSTLATIAKTENNNITVTKNTSPSATCLALVINPKIEFN